MKVLFIESRTGGDFTMDAVWAGLVDRFGPGNVIDFPPKEKHREGIPQATGDIEKDYGAERRSLCYTPNPGLLPILSKQDISRLLFSGEIERIFIDERDESFLIYSMLGARFTKVPVVVIAGHDRFWNRSPETLRDMYGANLQAMFLDNWRESYGSLKNAFPMSYATNFDHLWDSHLRAMFLRMKVYPICFMGYNSHGDRGKIVDHLVQKYGAEVNRLFVEKRPNTMDSFIRKNEYFRIMAQSKVCINLRGGAECGKALRFYEIPYVGSYMLSQRDNARQVYPFIDGVHCDYFSSIEELDQKIESALINDVRREEIAAAGHEHAMKYHTARARVDYIYGCLNGQS